MPQAQTIITSSQPSAKVIKIPIYKWEQAAAFSLFMAVVASIITVLASMFTITNNYLNWLCIGLYLASLFIGAYSIHLQRLAARTKVIYFDETNWTPLESVWKLVIESEIMLFRIEIRRGENFEEVEGGVSTDIGGTKTFVKFSGTDIPLKGRIVIK